MKNYFSILEIKADSSQSDIRKAFRRLAKLYHPDVNKSKNATEKFIEISEAYDFLISRQKYREDKAETESDRDEYEKFRQEAHSNARQRAKMRYDEFRKQHEAFQKSGIDDLILLIKIIVRVALIPLFFFLLLLPVQQSLTDWKMIFLLIITWPFAGTIAWFIYDKRKHYFIPGRFFYSLKRIREVYTKTKITTQRCYYMPSESANSKPYKIDLLKLRDLKIRSEGFRQHYANYINEKSTILIPRSRKAFVIHSFITAIKIFSILSCLIFLNVNSITWRIIIGLAAGGIIGNLVLLATRAKSNVSYLFSFGSIFRLSIWILFISLVSDFSLHPFNINTSDDIYFVITAIVIFDCFLMQLVNLLFGKYASRPVNEQFHDVTQKFNSGYKVYNDVPVISVIYPVFIWIFG